MDTESMLSFRVIAALVAALLVFVVVSFVWTMMAPNAGRLDAIAARRIHQRCGFSAECRLQVGDLFDGDFDVFYEFGPEVTQAQVDSIVGPGIIAVHEGRRILAFARGEHIFRVEYERDGLDTPLRDEIEFESERHREERGVRYDRDQWLRVNTYPIDSTGKQSGTYYVLTATSVPAS